MKALLIAAGLFFSICGGLFVTFAVSGAGHEYDLKFVLPIDARQMPAAVEPPVVVSRLEDADASGAVTQGRAGAGSTVQAPERPPVQLGGRIGAAAEAPPQD